MTGNIGFLDGRSYPELQLSSFRAWFEFSSHPETVSSWPPSVPTETINLQTMDLRQRGMVRPICGLCRKSPYASRLVEILVAFVLGLSASLLSHERGTRTDQPRATRS